MYRELYEAWKKEKENDELQPLSKGFYAQLAGYVNKIRKEDRMLDRKTVKAQLVRCESNNVRNLVEKLVQLRYRKILRLLSSGRMIQSDKLTAEEEKLCSRISSSLESYQSFLKDVLRGKLSNIENKDLQRRVVVRFLLETPAIVGIDLKTYGPFKLEDVAVLPSENANVLIKQDIAKKIQVK